MNKGFPDRRNAEKIWQDGIDYHLAKPYGFEWVEDYRQHSRIVGETAEKIAAHIPGMDSEKAFVLGLLHDHGKRVDEKIENIFHGQEGYQELLRLGYPVSARICLTHTFPDKDFQDGEYKFSDELIKWLRQTLQHIEYDDYDLLIILCDKMAEAGQIISMERRVNKIVGRYNLSNWHKDLLLKQCARLKTHFDKKIGGDIYELIGIKD